MEGRLKALTAEDVQRGDTIIVSGAYFEVEYIGRRGDLLDFYVKDRFNPITRPQHGLIYVEEH